MEIQALGLFVLFVPVEIEPLQAFENRGEGGVGVAFDVEARAYGSDQALNTDHSVEAVVVAVRVPAHYQLTKNALDAGKHVFCEWPLGANTKRSSYLGGRVTSLDVTVRAKGASRRGRPDFPALERWAKLFCPSGAYAV